LNSESEAELVQGSMVHLIQPLNLAKATCINWNSPG